MVANYDSGSSGCGQGYAAARFSNGFINREPFLIRARRCAALTIPSLFRPMGATEATDTPQAWQSLGAYCVNNLSSKLSLSMFPPGLPFIRLKPSRLALKDMAKLPPDQRGQAKQAVSAGLSAVEQEFVDGVDEDGDVDPLTITLKHLIVGGNHGLQMYKDGQLREFQLEKFVTFRDYAGNLIEAVVQDTLSWNTLPRDVAAFIRDKRITDPSVQNYNQPSPTVGQAPGGVNSEERVTLYTHMYLRNGMWEVYQEVMNLTVPNTEWRYDKDSLPFIFPTGELLMGENYGRSYCENYEAELQTLDGLEQTVAEGSAAAALFIRLVKPGGLTNKTALSQALNGDVITGDPNDVGVVDNTKAIANFTSAEKRIAAKEDRLSRAFLLNSSIQRSGERVTAEEIRFMAQELQDALGGVYSGQVSKFQRPYVMLKQAALQRTNRMTVLPKAAVKTKLITGAAALSRNAELQSLDALASPPQSMQQVAATIIKPSMFFARRATALGLDADGLILTEEEIAAQQAKAQQQAQLQEATPSLIKAGGDMMKQGMQHSSDMALQQNQQQADQASAQQQPQGPSQS